VAKLLTIIANSNSINKSLETDELFVFRELLLNSNGFMDVIIDNDMNDGFWDLNLINVPEMKN